MGTFACYLEGEDRFAADRALTALGYLMGWEPATIAALPLETIMATIQKHSLLPTKAWSVVRFAAMIKRVARENAT